LKNHIIGKGNFSDSMTNHYLSILLYHKMLTSSKDKVGRTYYSTTDKGRQFVRYYGDIQHLFLNSAKPRDSDVHASGLSNANATIGIHTSGPQRVGAKRIMIVDDESDISSAMQIGLEEENIAVDVFNDPNSALAAYKAQSYDLLLFDVRMPMMNGFELYRRIREIDDRAKVCFLTAFEVYSEEFKKVFPSMDVHSFIQKPISMPELVEQIRALTEEQ
jgi:CheY-like chemotaxis protein